MKKSKIVIEIQYDDNGVETIISNHKKLSERDLVIGIDRLISELADKIKDFEKVREAFKKILQ